MKIQRGAIVAGVGEINANAESFETIFNLMKGCKQVTARRRRTRESTARDRVEERIYVAVITINRCRVR